MKAPVKNVHASQAYSIRGTGSVNNHGNISQETEWADECFLFTMGASLDAPDVMPAGGVAAQNMRNGWGDRWNVPVQSLTVRA